MKGGYFLYNGQFRKEDEAVFSVSDLACRADGFDESFRAEHNELLFPESICRHLLATANAINLNLSELIDPDGRLLRKDVSRLLNKNKLYQAAKICVQIYPAGEKVNMILSAREIEPGYYPVNETGLLLSFYGGNLTDHHPQYPDSSFGNYFRRVARVRANEWNKPEMILLNREGYASESIEGSFAYLEKERVFFTSEGSEGYQCAIRDEVMSSVKAAGLEPLERKNITSGDLLQAEELFLYDACNGIRKVLGLEDRRYFSTKSQLIAEKFSDLARKERKMKD